MGVLHLHQACKNETLKKTKKLVYGCNNNNNYNNDYEDDDKNKKNNNNDDDNNNNNDDDDNSPKQTFIVQYEHFLSQRRVHIFVNYAENKEKVSRKY